LATGEFDVRGGGLAVVGEVASSAEGEHKCALVFLS
jgi:hypothetical protein